jgi:hypothetical protein
MGFARLYVATASGFLSALIGNALLLDFFLECPYLLLIDMMLPQCPAKHKEQADNKHYYGEKTPWCSRFLWNYDWAWRLGPRRMPKFTKRLWRSICRGGTSPDTGYVFGKSSNAESHLFILANPEIWI